MDGIHIDFGDQFTVGTDEDGAPAIRVDNAVWVGEPRLISFSAAGHDRAKQISELITALYAVAGSEVTA